MSATDSVVRVALTRGIVALVDLADWERSESTCGFASGFIWSGRLSSRKWRPLVKDHTTYAICLLQGGHELRLHRGVLCATAGQLVDHWDHDGLNNRRSNLRIATSSGNKANSRVHRGSTSQFKGVAIYRQTNRFESYIRFLGRKRHLGLFGSEETAARAYDEAARRLFGQFACVNFPLPGERSARRTLESVA